MEKLYPAGSSNLPEAKHTIEILANIKAKKGFFINTPTAKIKLGDAKAGVPVTIETQGAFRVDSNSFDLENGVVGTYSAKVHAPLGIKIGRLMRDPTKEVISTFYVHGQENNAHHLGSNIRPQYYEFLGERVTQGLYDGHHLLTLPFAVSNQSTLLAKNQLELIGPVQNQGHINAEDLVLDSSTAEGVKTQLRQWWLSVSF